jgi:hypothetical protein
MLLPADIYTDGTLIIDDGYDRAKLNAPGVLHIERVARWSQERPSHVLPGRSSGPTAHWHLEAFADCALATPLPLPPAPNRPQGVDLAARPPLPRVQVQSVAGARPNNAEETLVEHDDPKSALKYNAMHGVEAKRWVSSDIAQPNTVEFWVCIFKVHMCHNVTTPDKWALEHKAFVKYITREFLHQATPWYWIASSLA